MEQQTILDVMDVCISLKKIRQDNKLSLESVAELSDIPKAAISKYERGAQMPKVTTLARWANVLGQGVSVTLSKSA